MLDVIALLEQLLEQDRSQLETLNGTLSILDENKTTFADDWSNGRNARKFSNN